MIVMLVLSGASGCVLCVSFILVALQLFWYLVPSVTLDNKPNAPQSAYGVTCQATRRSLMTVTIAIGSDHRVVHITVC